MKSHVHEGGQLQEWLTSEGMSPENLARRLGVKKQTVYYHIGRATIGDSFKKKLQQLRSNPFDEQVKDIAGGTAHADLVDALKELNHVRKQLEECHMELAELRHHRKRK
jgi:DNA-binding transcriptional ArsR family regulator